MEKDIKKLRYYYLALKGQKKLLDETKPLHIHHSTIGVIEDIFNEIEENFPDLVPKFNSQDFYSHRAGEDDYYHYIGISSFIGNAISRLKVEIEESE